MVLAAETPGLAAVAGCEARRQRNCPTRAPYPPQLWGIYGTLDKPSVWEPAHLHIPNIEPHA